MVELKRKIYDEMLERLRDNNNRQVLEVQGARQVGKTYIINKFAKEKR